MHKILKPTELVRLRALGFEVFNPPYHSTVYDQSADLRLDLDQPSTLPPDVFQQLHAYNFFYNAISDEIAELLNAHFDAIIVTINPDWLSSIAAVYKGRLIFRTYGQPYSMSDYLIQSGLRTRLEDLEEFAIIPFAEESIALEQRWFQDLCTHIVPYQLPDDVFDCGMRWMGKDSKPEIAVNIPNISNVYYEEHYTAFAKNCPEGYFRILGPQREFPPDPRVLGGMTRRRFLLQLTHSRGYFYPYMDNVCYLPPVEMMQLGGPVIFLPGSLLSKFSYATRPGAARDYEDAKTQLNKLVSGDWILAQDIIAAQEPVRKRYDREVVKPIFDAAFTKALTESMPGRHPVIESTSERVLLILLHVDGLFHIVGGTGVASEGIPRVTIAIVEAIASAETCHIVLTCTTRSKPALQQVFSVWISCGRVSLLTIDQISSEMQAPERLGYVTKLNSGTLKADLVFVPHYYLFPEAILIRKDKTIYLPDFFPHLMPDLVFDGSLENDQRNKRIGNLLGHQATKILTNSRYSAGYLPAADFCEVSEAASKIVVAPLPLLGIRRRSDEHPKPVGLLKPRGFIFYPTANRPNKKLDFLLRVLSHLRFIGRDLKLLLTCDIGSVEEVKRTFYDLDLSDHIIFKPGLDEAEMEWCYRNCALMCLTSIAEGNFPPQMLEALNYDAPIVATRLPTVTELVGEDDSELLLCEPLELVDFVDKVEIALSDRDTVLISQRRLLKRLESTNSLHAFASKLKEAFFQVM